MDEVEAAHGYAVRRVEVELAEVENGVASDQRWVEINDGMIALSREMSAVLGQDPGVIEARTQDLERLRDRTEARLAALRARRESVRNDLDELRADFDRPRREGRAPIDMIERDAAADAVPIEEILADIAHREREARGPVLTVTTAGVVATPDGLAALAEQAKTYAAGARAPATRRAYRSDWTAFETFCAGHGLDALPADPATVGLFLARDAEVRAPATLARRLAAISIAHALAGHHLDTRAPAIRDVMRGVRRAKGVAPRRQAAPLTTGRLVRLLDTCSAGRLIDLRDRALLLVGFTGALRQSEIVALDIEDVTVVEEGIRGSIRRSKADQEGEGQVVAIGRTDSTTCPAAAYAGWIAVSEIATGAVFRRVDRHGRLLPSRLAPEAIADVVRAGRAGLDDPERYSGHSLVPDWPPPPRASRSAGSCRPPVTARR